MTVAVLIVAGVVVIVTLGLGVLVALRISRDAAEVVRAMTDAHARTLGTLERVHDRNMVQLGEMADRFMALDFSTFKAYQMAGAAEEGGFEEPETGRVERMAGNGVMSAIGADIERHLRAAAEEEKILAEDFPEGWDANR